MLSEYNNNISFEARLGPNLKSYLLENEFSNDISRVEKFERLFSDTFSRYIDTNTYIERKPNGKFEIFNFAFPKIKVPINILDRKDRTLAQNILNGCSVAYGRAEYVLFQRYIASQLRKGKTLETIQKVGESALDNERKPYFLDLIGTAKRILSEDTTSELDEIDFSNMINIQLRELLNTPKIQELISKIFKKEQ